MIEQSLAPPGRLAPDATKPRLRLFADTLYFDDGEEVAAPMLVLTRADATALRTIESLGATPVEDLDDCALDPSTRADYVLLGLGDVHAKCAFTAYAIPQLRALGWEIEIDADYPWQVVATEAPMYAAAEPDADRPDWFALELGIELDGHRVNLLPALLDLLDGAGDLGMLTKSLQSRRAIAIQVDAKRWLPIPPARLKLLSRVLVELYRNGNSVRTPAVCAPVIAELCATLHDGTRPLRWIGDPKIRDRAYEIALGPRRPAAFTQPTGLQAELRPYQREGVAWLQHLRSIDAGGVLADDMGLGKTLQTITHILIEKQQGRLDRPAMIVTLTSLVGNWLREIAKFAPQLKAGAYHGPHRKDVLPTLGELDVIVTTYPLCARDRDELSAIPLHLVVLDEAHAVKNHDAQASEAVRLLDARHRVCLSGTPIENHLGELWSMFDFLMPGLLGTRDEFTTQLRIPIEQHADKVRLEALRSRVKPYILRRTKDAVTPELPAKTSLVRAIELSGAQRELYESIRVAAHADVRKHIKTHGLARSQIAILDALLKLRQVCCDPRLVSYESAREVKESAKLEVLLDMVTSSIADGRRILIFSQFSRMLGLVSEGLLGKGVGHVTLTGATPDRQKPIDAFQQGRADVFLISLKAGGAGLNLVGADMVIHYDPWWNPAAQAQATDRAHRIGQTKPVFVYDLIAAGSVEERMLGLQKHKRALADSILAPGAGPAPSLCERDVDDLLAPLT